MNEEKIRKKYPNIKTEEEFEKLCKMLRYKNNEKVAILCTCALLVLGAILYGLNLIIAIICVIAAFVVLVIGAARWGSHIDNYFLATASRKKAENRKVLTPKIIRKTHILNTIGEMILDLFNSYIISILCLLACSFILMLLDKADGKFPVSTFFLITPLVIFVILRIGAIIKRRKTKNSPYILLHTKVADRKVIGSSDPGSSSENYYFVFNCANYGMLDYEVSSYGYHSVFIGRDEYYLVVVKRRFSKKHKIAAIFFAEEYVLSPELEKLVKTV